MRNAPRDPSRIDVPSPATPAAAAVPLDHEHEVLEALRAMQFGTLEITVHQSRIVQITRSEKVRF